MPQQELTHGKTVAQKFSNLGYRGPVAPLKPRYMLGMIVGRPGSGKTRFVGSSDSCFIFNLDLSSIPHPNPQAVPAITWPVIGPGGDCLGEEGKTVKLTWEEILAKRDQILNVQGPIPDMYVMDSLAGVIHLVRDYVIRKQRKKHWRDLDGRAGWDMVYDEIVHFPRPFREIGKGFFFTCHIVDKIIPVGEDRYKEKLDMTLPPGLWKRLYWQFELVVPLEEEWTDETYQVPQPDLDLGGRKVKAQPLTKTRRIHRHILTTNKEEYMGITKTRTQIESLVLPPEDAWAVFESHYVNSNLNGDSTDE